MPNCYDIADIAHRTGECTTLKDILKKAKKLKPRYLV